ncbi:hypothetical protein M231_01210 [Tremella mesenterica]|uniref:Uncharacterized protein n=1 Tax=Tremella mesenterica TaxID=5217 RepID=A0A4Q1BU54_TREME|nr:uncharacterized protein TREMEDRAFT_64160 [Tremella mesenterica DSM 1558]EIW67569.1 hypothetical protein TREMEDRAFT_64160 [Tremella mesenterica DSM 1558]RXK41502.1 hypothetical protein M231_01210 [Tremella mesenterica]
MGGTKLDSEHGTNDWAFACPGPILSANITVTIQDDYRTKSRTVSMEWAQTIRWWRIYPGGVNRWGESWPHPPVPGYDPPKLEDPGAMSIYSEGFHVIASQELPGYDVAE